MDISAITTVLRSPVVSTGAWAVAGGAWALVPVGRARGLTRALIVGVPAAAATAVVAAGRPPAAARPPQGEGSLRAAVLVPVAAGGVVAFTHWAALSLDRGVEALLVRRGVRRPRLVLAAASAVLTPLFVVLDRPASANGRGPRTRA